MAFGCYQVWDIFKEGAELDYNNWHFTNVLSQFIQPVPLTEGLLVCCGFEDTNRGYRATGVEVSYAITHPNGGARIIIYQSPKPPFDTWSLPYNRTEFKYLHQLQNLFFALTGEELQITEI